MSLMYLNFLHKHDHVSIFGARYKLFENIRLIICPISTLLLHITLFYWAGENEGPSGFGTSCPLVSSFTSGREGEGPSPGFCRQAALSLIGTQGS